MFSVKQGKDVFAGHEALLDVFEFQVVDRQHVLLLLLLQGAKEKHTDYCTRQEERKKRETPWVRNLTGE